ncbi:MAG: glycosyltransferase [Muribaculaceae bacterium]|nr:glycosyltransferase [Muribaculaceae bacterium]MCM1560721.1 glycosyltransferase [Butyrivibrio sp.]
MSEEVLEILEEVKRQGQISLEMCRDTGQEAESLASRAVNTALLIDAIESIVPAALYKQYKEFFSAFSVFCKKCGDQNFLLANRDKMISSLELFDECMDDLKNRLLRIKKCPCCGHEVFYLPLPDYYSEMQKRFHVSDDGRAETLNQEEYSCPDCGASDRDRLIISFLKKEGLQEAAEETRVLQIAPAASISGWIMRQCPHIKYETTDLFMEHVIFRSDIMNMETVCDETYDVIICAHVLEHVRDDRKALSEMKRILKPEGKIVFLVPINLNASAIDEEWGLPEDENWRRFGQEDHCRAYDKQGLLQRLEEQFFVHSLGKEYFGEDVFAQCGLTDTSTLYVLTKSQAISLSMAEEVMIDQRLCTEGPLVSVVMSCYNHGAFVADAIESVIGQSYKNIEFLVADDGSSDDSVSVMQRYSEHYSEEHYFTDNFGERFSFLWERAHGKYIALINSDDVWEKDKLYFQVKYLEEHEDCGACFTWSKYVDENLVELENNTFRQANRSNSEWMRFFWQHGNVLSHPSSLIRKKYRLEPPRYANSCWQLYDMFKWVDMVQYSSIHIIPKFLTTLRRHDRNGVRNVSACTMDNMRRHLVEEGHNWFWTIRGMEDSFFKEAFGELMVNPQASTEQEIKCEKYFLLLSHRNPYTRNDAICYLFEIFNEVETCMQDKYAYTKKIIKDDVLTKADFYSGQAGSSEEEDKGIE